MSDRKVALVTGSGKKRVGWHVADALAERGYALAIHFRRFVFLYAKAESGGGL